MRTLFILFFINASLLAQDVPHLIEVLNLPPDSISEQGQHIIQGHVFAGDHLLLQTRNNEGLQYHILLSADGTEVDTLTVQGNIDFPEENDYLGTVNNRLYFTGELLFTALYEIDLETHTFRERNDLLPMDQIDQWGNSVLVDGKLYLGGLTYLNSPQRVVRYLVEIDLTSDESNFIVSDTTLNLALPQSPYLASDGETIFFAKLQGEAIGPAAYSPSTEIISILGPSESETFYYFLPLGSNVFVRYQRPTTVESPLYPISLSGLGEPLPFPPGIDWRNVLDLDDRYLFVVFDQLVSIDKVTKDTSIIVANDGNLLPKLTQITARGAVFFKRVNGSSVRQTLWRTDGTSAGTRKVLDVPIGVNTVPQTVVTFGRYLALAIRGGTRFYLFDPATEFIELVDASPNLGTNKGGLVTIGDQLFFNDIHETYGEQIHRISATRQVLTGGTVFHDENGDGVRNISEPGIANSELTVTGGNNRTLFTRSDGTFSLPVQTNGTYVIEARAPSCYETLTTPASYSITYFADSTYQLDFGYADNSGPATLRTLLNSSTIRCGFEHNFWLTVINDGCQPLAGQASVTFPEEMQYLESDEAPINQDGSSLTFAFDTLQPNGSQRIRIRFRMPDENFAGLPIELSTNAGAIDGDGAVIESDTFAYSEILRCAIDPNDKQVSPSRQEPSGSNYTQIDEKLRYTIRFQNTGNDTAFTVRIQDQISESLNLETFKPLSASHPYGVSVRDDRTVVFLFENILLPDSTTNLPLSQGFVTFEINAFPDLDDFSTIDNTAGIYFDFNQPVITNTVSSTIVEFLDEDQDGFFFYDECDDRDFDINPAAEEIPNNGIDENCDELDDFPVATSEQLSGHLEAFPNPSMGGFTLQYSKGMRLDAKLYNLMGQELERFSFQRYHELDLSELPAGIYLLRLAEVDAQERATIKLIRR